MKLVLQSVLMAVVLSACGGGSTSNGGEVPPPGGDGGDDGGDLPAIIFSASKTVITQGESITLNWSVLNADHCQASGAWAGQKKLADSMVIGAITQDSDYILSCDGPAGKNSKTVSVTVVISDDVISGTVDSSYIDRTKTNTIYVYKGDVTPDDYDGDGDPIQAIPVTQVENSCTWQYSVGQLPAGKYTLAFTTGAADDVKGVDNVLVFDKSVLVTKGDSGITQHFVAKHILQVGPGKNFTTLSAASKAISDGDTILIDAGVYEDDIAVWRRNNITLRAVGGVAHLKATNVIPYDGSDTGNGMGIWVFKGSNINVENIKFSEARIPVDAGANGAGIRIEGSNITVCNCSFHDNENGILGVGNNVLIEYSEFNHNGLGEYGRTHNIYIVNGSKFTFRHNYSHHAYIGHNLKSRAKENYILYNRLMDEVSGQSSYAIDIPDGGKTYIIGNLIQQGQFTDNTSAIISYGAEGGFNQLISEFYLVNNTIVNDGGTNAFVFMNGRTPSRKIINNIFLGKGQELSGYDTLPEEFNNKGNLKTTDGNILLNRTDYDYKLTAAATSAINAGIDPGLGNDGFDLRPYYQYLHPSQREARSDDSQIDIGAYEYQ